MKAHATAVIHPSAEIDDDVSIGPYSVIGERVKIGSGTILRAHVTLESETVLGSQNELFPGVVIGAPPQDLRWKGEFSQVILGNRNVIREHVTLHRGTGGGPTTIGDENYIMAYSHAGHNVKIGNNCILANCVQLAGYVELEDRVNIGGLVGVHQFVRIGAMTMIGGLSRIIKDIPPFVKANGNPARVYGLNVVGLRRNGVPAERREILKKAYNLVYRAKMNLSEAIAEIERSLPLSHEVRHFVEFMKNPSRQGVLNREDSETAVAID